MKKSLLCLLLALCMSFCCLAACEAGGLDNSDKAGTTGTATAPESITEIGTGGESESITETETGAVSESTTEATTMVETEPSQNNLTHSDEYYAIKDRWYDIWNVGVGQYNTYRAFYTKAAPFTFLAEQGAVYFDESGMPHPYGCNDNSKQIHLSVQTRAFIDANTPENDLYLLVQYRDGELENGNTTNSGVVIATWMLKYTIDDDCYRDLLLLSGDFRAGLLIQQIDKVYEPEIISKSVVRVGMLDGYRMFKNLDNGNNQYVLDSFNTDPANYIANVDYDNMSITVNYSDTNDNGKIYSYTYKVKETPNWDNALIGDNYFTDPIDKEYRDSLTVDQIMSSNQTELGRTLNDCSVNGPWMLRPSDEQKSTAELLYDFDRLIVTNLGSSSQFNKYELGKIPFEAVNDFTRQYAKDHGWTS